MWLKIWSISHFFSFCTWKKFPILQYECFQQNNFKNSFISFESFVNDISFYFIFYFSLARKSKMRLSFACLLFIVICMTVSARYYGYGAKQIWRLIKLESQQLSWTPTCTWWPYVDLWLIMFEFWKRPL
jgi:hypothetical protein